MSITLKIAEITDPFAEDFGLVTNDVVLEDSCTLQEFLNEQYPGEDSAAYINCEKVDDTYKLQDRNFLLVAFGTGKSKALMMIASIAIMVVAWYAAPAMMGIQGGMAAAMAANSLGTMIAFSAINMIGNYLVNALLAPDLPDADSSGFDQSKSYLWSGQSNKSDQMTPIPVVLGEFRIAGNLINSFTHSFNVNKSGYAIQDTYYLLYGLTANELDSVDKCLINNMDANTFGAEDRSVYYTLGAQTQHPLNTDSSLKLYEETPISPENTGLLFPDLVTELITNKEVALPNHYKYNIYEDQEVSILGQPKANTIALLDSAISSTDTTITFILQYDSDPIDTTGMLKISYMPDEWNPKEEPIEYNNAVCNGSSCTVNVVKRGTPAYDFPINSDITFYAIEYETIQVPVDSVWSNSANNDATWQPGEYKPQETYSSATISNTDLDDIVIQLVFPQGLRQLTDNGKERVRWVIFDFKISREHLGQTHSIEIQMPIYDSPSFTEGHDELPKYWVEGSLTKKYSICEYWTNSHFVEYKLVDILHDLKGDTWLTHQSETNNLVLEKDYSYTVGIRIRDYGYTYKYKGRPDPTNSGHTDFTDVTLSRLKGLKFSTSLNYPNVSTLGLVLDATPTVSGRLPLVQADVKGKYYVYTGIEIASEVSTWPRTTTSNPAYLAINMMYNSLWGAGIGGAESSGTKDADFASAVDIAKFIELADYCDFGIPLKEGDAEIDWKPRYTFNGLYDVRTSFWKALQTILSVANAVPIYDGNKISVYYEKAESSVSQVFTSSNILEGSFTESFLGYGELAECLSGNFLDKNNNYEKTSYMYIYPEGDPKKTQNIELIGLVEEERAVKALQYKLNKTNLLKRVFKFSVADSSALVSDVGSLIGVQSNFIDFGSAGSTVSISGRLTNIDIGNVKVTLDKKLTTFYDSLLIKTLEGNLRTYTILFTDNTGDYTVYTLSSSTYLDECSNLDTYIVGTTSTYYKEATISSLSIKNDLSVDIEAICYDSSLFSGLYGFIINSQISPELTQALCRTNNETATYSSVYSSVSLHWSEPLGTTNYTDVNGDTQNPLFSVENYLIYKKSGAGTYTKITETPLLTYVDKDIDFKETFSYKIVPVISYKGYIATIPLSWCTVFSVQIAHQLFDYLEAPDWELTATKNRDNELLYDINFIIENPNDWAFSSGLEGFVLFIRASDTDDTSEWFGPTDIHLTRDYTVGSSSIFVNKIDGLSMTFDGSVTLGLILVDDNDIMAVYSSVYTGSDYQLSIYTTDTSYQFSAGLSHSAGATVYNAHKGFFPSIAYSIGGWTTLFESESTIRVLSPNGAILGYDNTTNKVTVIDELNNGSNFFPNDYIYLDGGTNTFSVITNMLADGVTVTGPISKYDFSINSVFHDVTGRQVAVYGITQESGIAGEGYQGQIKYDESNKIIATIEGYPVTHKYYWAAILRAFFPKVQNQTNNSYGYLSVPKIKGI